MSRGSVQASTAAALPGSLRELSLPGTVPPWSLARALPCWALDFLSVRWARCPPFLPCQITGGGSHRRPATQEGPRIGKVLGCSFHRGLQKGRALAKVAHRVRTYLAKILCVEAAQNRRTNQMSWIESRFCLLAMWPWASRFVALRLSSVSHLLKGLGDDTACSHA